MPWRYYVRSDRETSCRGAFFGRGRGETRPGLRVQAIHPELAPPLCDRVCKEFATSLDISFAARFAPKAGQELEQNNSSLQSRHSPPSRFSLLGLLWQ